MQTKSFINETKTKTNVHKIQDTRIRETTSIQRLTRCKCELQENGPREVKQNSTHKETDLQIKQEVAKTRDKKHKKQGDLRKQTNKQKRTKTNGDPETE